MPDAPGFEADEGAHAQRSDELLEELHVELADHLASAAEELVRGGIPPEEARAAAQSRFGNIQQIVRRCWWIRKGDEVMTRVLGTTLLALVLAGVATLALGGWQFQRTMSGRIDSLSEQLGTLAKTQEEMLTQQARNLPVQITGRAYLGDPSRPAAGTFIQVYTAPPKKMDNQPYDFHEVRTILTETDGSFQSGPLEPGSYSLLAPYVDRQGKPLTSDHLIQTELFHLYQSGQQKVVELDLLPRGLLTIELAEPRPDRISTPDGDVQIVFLLRGSGPGPMLPYPPAAPLLPGWKWPLSGRSFTDLLVPSGTAPSAFPVTLPIPPGEHSLRVSLDRWSPRQDYNRFSGLAASEFIWLDIPDGGEVKVGIHISDEVKEKLPAVLAGEKKYEKHELIQLEVTPSERRIPDPYAALTEKATGG